MLSENPIKLSPSLFENGLEVVNRSQRYIVYLTNERNETCLVPTEKVASPSHLDNYEGLVFFNAKDHVWQCASGAKKQALIINDITPDQAKQISEKHKDIAGLETALCLSKAAKLVEFAQNSLGIEDFYFKGVREIQRDTSIIDSRIPHFVRVTSPSIYRAIYLEGAFTYQGPVLQNYSDGAVIVFNGKSSWAIETQVFLNNYRLLVNGQEETFTSIDKDFFAKGLTLSLNTIDS